MNSLLLFYFAFLLAALFAVGNAFILAITSGLVLCIFYLAQFGLFDKTKGGTYGDRVLERVPGGVAWCLFYQLMAFWWILILFDPRNFL